MVKPDRFRFVGRSLLCDHALLVEGKRGGIKDNGGCEYMGDIGADSQGGTIAF